MLAAIYHSSVIRLVPIGLLLLGLQNTLLVDMRPFGVMLQILLAFSVAAGVAGGSDKGAIAGFVLGVMYDLALRRPIGESAIAFSTGGVIGGWIHLIRVEKRWWLNALFMVLGSAVGEFMVPLIKALMGESDAFIVETWKIIPVVAIASGLLSPILVPAARWAMRVQSDDWKPQKVKSLETAS